MKQRYVVQFRVPDGTILFAGPHKDGLGFATTTKTALVFGEPETAGRIAANGYGSLTEYAHVMLLLDNGDVEELE